MALGCSAPDGGIPKDMPRNVGGGGGGGGSSPELDFDGGTGDGGLADGDVCEGVRETAEPQPLQMIVVIDRSGSMTNQHYWVPLQQALVQFIRNPLSEGLRMGLNYFPAPSGGNSCDPSLWNPIQVPPSGPPLARLPEDANALADNIESMDTGDQTPMYGALVGSYQVAHAVQAAYPNDKVVVVLASDGLPNACSGDQNDVDWLATDLVAPELAVHGIETYAIAIDAAVLSAMHTIAAAGGTVQAYDVSQDTSDLAEEMAAIQGAAVGCEFMIPQSTEEFDPFKVNLSITIGGAAPEAIPQADDEADCGDDAGWYYDNPAEPRRILLCPASCEAITTAQDGGQSIDVEVKFGCPTKLN
jgi:hypothetical protein